MGETDAKEISSENVPDAERKVVNNTASVMEDKSDDKVKGESLIQLIKEFYSNRFEDKSQSAQTAIKIARKKLIELESSLLHLHQNLDIPHISLVIHEKIIAFLDQVKPFPIYTSFRIKERK